jgi:hypothetical protein
MSSSLVFCCLHNFHSRGSGDFLEGKKSKRDRTEKETEVKREKQTEKLGVSADKNERKDMKYISRNIERERKMGREKK